MISLGIDPGTSSYDLVAIENGRVVYHSNLSSIEVKKNPKVLLDEIKKCDADVIAGLSGYGLPVKKFSKLNDRDIFLMTLNLEEEFAIGLRRVIELVRSEDLNAYTIPGIIHLKTIPDWRKINRIDMGTADKLCSVALALYQLSKEKPIEDINFVLAEIGFGFTSFIAVKNGKVVDAIGGTSGFPGYSSIGALDAELAYLIGSFPKKFIYSGGIKSFVEDKGLKEREIEILAEFTLKGLKAVEVSLRKSDLCILSGRFAEELRDYVSDYYRRTVILKGFGVGKQSAQGAALIANGIACGEFKRIVEHLEILNASGTVFDYITSDVKKYLRDSNLL